MDSFIGTYSPTLKNKVLAFKLSESVNNCWPFTTLNIVPRQFSEQNIGTKSSLQHLFCAPEKNCELIDQSSLGLWTLTKIERMKNNKILPKWEHIEKSPENPTEEITPGKGSH